jgi:PD-(D/E)XK nuclease superfamily
VTTAAEFLADNTRADYPRFDGFNRYVLPHPDTGKDFAWTRVTTFARALRDTFALTRWQLRMAGRGLCVRGDLVARIASQYGDDDVIDKAVADAMEHAGSTVKATYGTALHRLTEGIDRDEEIVEPPELRGDLDAYRGAVTKSGLIFHAIEQIVCIPDLGLAGTLDRIVSAGADAFVWDLKTGDVDQAWLEIAVQLACYAHALYLWDGDRWAPMLPVNQSIAIVAHLPTGEGHATLYAVDIARGWQAAQLCRDVRQWRNVKDLAKPWTPTDLGGGHGAGGEPRTGYMSSETPAPHSEDAPASPDAAGGARSDWLRDRLMALAGNDRARALVANRWPEGVAVRGPWADADIDRLDEIVAAVEREIEASWPPGDPARSRASTNHLRAVESPPETPELPQPDDAGPLASEADLIALRGLVGFLDDARKAMLSAWLADAQRADRAMGEKPVTARRLACAHAAVACASHFDEDVTRRALARVPCGSLPDAWPTGAVLGSLTASQAEALVNLTLHPEDLEPF